MTKNTISIPISRLQLFSIINSNNEVVINNNKITYSQKDGILVIEEVIVNKS